MHRVDLFIQQRIKRRHDGIWFLFRSDPAGYEHAVAQMVGALRGADLHLDGSTPGIDGRIHRIHFTPRGPRTWTLRLDGRRQFDGGERSDFAAAPGQNANGLPHLNPPIGLLSEPLTLIGSVVLIA